MKRHGAVCYGQVYLVGDPAQLPATVMSERAVAHGYTRSLFQRLQTIGHPVQVWRPSTQMTALPAMPSSRTLCSVILRYQPELQQST